MTIFTSHTWEKNRRLTRNTERSYKPQLPPARFERLTPEIAGLTKSCTEAFRRAAPRLLSGGPGGKSVLGLRSSCSQCSLGRAWQRAPRQWYWPGYLQDNHRTAWRQNLGTRRIGCRRNILLHSSRSKLLMNPQHEVQLNASILIIEDNPADAHLLDLALEQHGVNGTRELLRDGEAALAWSEGVAGGTATPPDLIILDLNLPSHDGIEVLAQFRRVPSLEKVPVAVFTSSESRAEKARANTHAIAAFVTKPADLDTFLARGAVFRGILEGLHAK